MASKITTCQFCGKDGPHPDAHILPNSLYRGEKGIAFKVVKVSGTEPAKRSQTGVYDDELWCQSCERASSEFDAHAAMYLLQADKLAEPYRDANGRRLAFPNGKVMLWTLTQVDPLRLHLFVLSVLWRASASKRREVAKFSLGPHQDRIKALLQSRDVDGLKDYGYLLRWEREEDLRGGFLCPVRTKYDGLNFVRFHGGGFCFDVKTSKGRMPDYFAPLANGPLCPVYLMEYSLLETNEGKALARGVRRASQLPRR